MHETTDQIRRDARGRRVLPGIPKQPSWLARWASEEVAMLRISLVLVYLGFINLAVASLRAGVPAFTLTAPDYYTPIWALLLAIAGLVAAIASTTDRWQAIERWAALGVTALMGAYVGTITILGFFQGDANRQAVASGLGIAFVTPALRFLWLALQAGKRKRKKRSA
jgi:hypothetical protein